MKANEQYSQFEGLAVKTAASVYAKWRGSLSRRGMTVEDAVQEAKLALLELIPRLDDPQYGPEQRTAYVAKSIRGHLSNWAAKQDRDGDHRDLPDPHEPDPDELLDLREALAKLDETTQAIVLARHGGASYRDLAERHGLSESAVRRIVKAAEATLKRLMHA